MMARKLKKYRPSVSQKKCQCNTTKVVFKKMARDILVKLIKMFSNKFWLIHNEKTAPHQVHIFSHHHKYMHLTANLGIFITIMA